MYIKVWSKCTYHTGLAKSCFTITSLSICHYRNPTLALPCIERFSVSKLNMINYINEISSFYFQNTLIRD